MKKIVLTLSVVLTTLSTQARVFLEPYLGYHSGTFKAQPNMGSESKSDITGLGYGLKIGYTFSSSLWFSADAYSGSLKAKDSSGTNPDSDVVPLQLAGLIGFQSSSGLKFYAGYIFDDQIKNKDSLSTSVLKGTGYKAGLGYKLKQNIAFNLDYISDHFTTFKDEGSGMSFDMDSLFSSHSSSALTFNISFPFEL